MLEVRALTRTYHRAGHVVRAVDGVDLRIERGEFLALVGASGSGKSTLLNLLAGLDSPTSGDVMVEGVALGALSRRALAAYRAHRVGMIFQAFNLLPHFTALQNVALALTLAGVARPERERRAAEVLQALGLGERLHHRPVDLSGGEQQRVAIARALVKGPEVLLADEPTGNLDADNMESVAEILSDSNRNGVTVVMATHDADLVRRLAGRIVRIHYGKLVDGPAVRGGAPDRGGASGPGGAQ